MPGGAPLGLRLPAMTVAMCRSFLSSDWPRCKKKFHESADRRRSIVETELGFLSQDQEATSRCPGVSTSWQSAASRPRRCGGCWPSLPPRHSRARGLPATQDAPAAAHRQGLAGEGRRHRLAAPPAHGPFPGRDRQVGQVGIGRRRLAWRPCARNFVVRPRAVGRSGRSLDTIFGLLIDENGQFHHNAHNER